MKSDDGAMRVRSKDCYLCNEPNIHRCHGKKN